MLSLRAKITLLEEELCKSRQDSSEYQNLLRKLENVMCECLSDLASSGYANFYLYLFPDNLNHDPCRRQKS